MRPPIFGIERYSIVIYFLKYNTNAVSIKFPMEVYYEIDKIIPKFTENTQIQKISNKTIKTKVGNLENNKM